MGDITKRTRQMRQNLTNAETLLWSRLKKLRGEGCHFRRQAPFRGYFLDFVSFNRRLVIELDGWRHNEDDQRAHDEIRDAVLRREGFQVLRFQNNSLDRNMDDVMIAIHTALAEANRPDK
jgi:very-short-patch-repair endonuclease